jgi:hypothetical protein
MIEDEAVFKNLEPGRITLMHLLFGIAFCRLIGMAMTQVSHSRGGMLRHFVAAPSCIAIGALIVSPVWKLSKALWLR